MTKEEITEKLAKCEKDIQSICDKMGRATDDLIRQLGLLEDYDDPMRKLCSIINDFVFAITEAITMPLQHECDELINTKAEDE